MTNPTRLSLFLIMLLLSSLACVRLAPGAPTVTPSPTSPPATITPQFAGKSLRIIAIWDSEAEQYNFTEVPQGTEGSAVMLAYADLQIHIIGITNVSTQMAVDLGRWLEREQVSQLK